MPIEFYVQQKPHFFHERLALVRFLEELRSFPQEKLLCVVIGATVQGQEKDLVLISERAVILAEIKSLTGVDPCERRHTRLSGDEAQWRYQVGDGPSHIMGGADAKGSPWTQIFAGRHQIAQWLADHGAGAQRFTKNAWLERLYGWVAIDPGFDGDAAGLALPDFESQFRGSREPWLRVLSTEDLAAAFYSAHLPGVNLDPAEVRRLALTFAPLCTDLAAVLPPVAVKPSVWTTPPVMERLVDREDARAVLLAALDDPNAAALVIQGAAGTGRTAVAAWLAGQAAVRHWRIRWLECAEVDETLSLDGFLAAVADDVVDLARDRIRDHHTPVEERMTVVLDYYRQRPTLFVFEDYHALKAQPDFHRFIERTARYRQDVKVLVTSREIVTDDLRPPDGVREVTLVPLRETAFGELAQILVRGVTLTPVDLHILWERLAGNPGALQVTTLLVRRCKLGNRLAELPLPETEDWFRGLTAALSDRAKALLRDLAVLRTRFDYDTIRVLAGEHNDAEAWALSLIDQYLLQAYDDGRYTVAPLVAAVQQAQLGAKAPDVHRSVAKGLLKLADLANDVPARRAALLFEALHHLDQGRAREEYLRRAEEAYSLLLCANDWDRAAAVAERAGVLLNGDAAAKALPSLADSERGVRWWTRAAELALERDQRERAAAHLAAAEALLPRPELKLSREQQTRWAPVRIELLLQQGRAAYQAPAYEAARGFCQAALALARTHDIADAEMRCLARLAQVERQQGRYAEARTHNLQVVEMARGRNDAELLCQGLSHLGLIARTEGQYDVALGHLEEALAVARGVNNPLAIEICLGHLGRTALLKGDLVTAEEKFRDCLQQARDLRSVRSVRFQLTNLCEALVRRGKVADAEALLEESERLNREAGDCIGQAFNLKHRGLLKKQAGEEEEGCALIRVAIHMLETAGNREYLEEFAAALEESAQLRLGLDA